MSMDDKKHIDQFVKRKLENRAFEYQDAFWEDAEKMIIANEKKRRRRGGYFLLFMGITMLLSAGGYWILGEELKRSHAMSSRQTNGNLNIAMTVPPIEMKEEGKMIEIIKEEVHIIPQRQKVSRNLESTKPTKRPTHKQENKADTQAENIRERVLNISAIGEPETELVLPTKSSMPASIAVPVKVEDVSDVLEKQVNIQSIDAFPHQQLDHEITLGKISRPSIPFKKHHWHLVAGGLKWNGIETQNGSKTENSLDPILGISYERRLGQRLSIHSDLRYQPRSGLGVAQSVSTTEFGFGVEQVTTQLIAERIHYISLPLYMKLQLKGRHHVLFGGSYAYIFQVSGDKLTETVSSLNGSSQTSENVSALSHHFEPSDFSLQAGYEYYVYKGASLGLSANYGLKNIYRREVGLKSHNLFFQVYLRYHLFGH